MTNTSLQQLLAQKPFKEWTASLLTRPSVFDAVKLPSTEERKNPFNTTSDQLALHTIHRGPFSRIYTLVTGSVGPLKTERMTSQVLRGLSLMADQSESIFFNGLDFLCSSNDASLGFSILKSSDPSKGNTLIFKGEQTEDTLQNVLHAIAPHLADSLLDKAEELESSILNRLKDVSSIRIWKGPDSATFDAKALMNALYGTSANQSVKSISCEGDPLIPLLIAHPQSLFSQSTFAKVTELRLRHCTLSEVEENTHASDNLRSLQICTPLVSLKTLTSFLPYCCGLEHLNIEVGSATPKEVVTLIKKVCGYSKETDVTISATNKAASKDSIQDNIRFIEQELTKEALSIPKSLVLDI